MKNKIFFSILFGLLSLSTAFAQIGINTIEPEPSAELDVTSTERGFLPPRMTSENRDDISNPAPGLIIYNTDDNNLQYFNGLGWFEINAVLIPGTAVCPSSITDSRDGQIYAVVEIGDQCWFAENLNYTPTSGNSWCYGNNSANCDTYGRLYDWNTVMGGAASSNANPSAVQGVCPPGWHVPSDAEWFQLTDFLGGEEVAGGKLKSTTGWNSPNTAATNSSEFSAFPGGFRNSLGNYYNSGFSGYWWSTSEVSPTNAWLRRLFFNYGDLSRDDSYKTYGFSCRCLRD